jgi:hypothetical protein
MTDNETTNPSRENIALRFVADGAVRQLFPALRAERLVESGFAPPGDIRKCRQRRDSADLAPSMSGNARDEDTPLAYQAGFNVSAEVVF